MSSGIAAEQQTFDGANTQKWIFTHIGSNVYTIRSTKNNSYYLGVQNDSTADETPIVLRTGTPTNGMKWKVEKTNQGYKIVSYSDPTMVLCTGTASATAGTNLKLSDFQGGNGSYQDEWEISRLEAALLAIPESYDRSSYFDNISQNVSVLGYEACFNNHSTIEDGVTRDQLLDYMKEAKIVLLRTHGTPTSVTTSSSSLTRNYLLSLPSDTLASLELVIYGACQTGEGGREGNNLLTATLATGARTAIGFENSIHSGACNVWCEAFFEGFANYYSNSQMDYYDVCVYAKSIASKHEKYEYINKDRELVSVRNYVVAGATSLPNG